MAGNSRLSREQILDTANRLVYEKGYNQTSFADVANTLGISKGNLHYHFRSKDELLNGIIDYRIQSIRNNIKQWNEEFPEARDRLKRFVTMLLNEEKALMRYGCPIGSLNMELGKAQRNLQQHSKDMFDILLEWLRKAFRQLGYKDDKAMSMHLLAMGQGASMMAHVYADSRLLKSECNKMLEWIDTL